MKSTVWDNLRKAYDANKGTLLTAEEVTDLVLIDTAIMDLTHPDRETGVPHRPKKPSKSSLQHSKETEGWINVIRNQNRS